MDPKCICGDASFISTISCCVSTACDTTGQQAALNYAKQICAPAGVTNLVSFRLDEHHTGTIF
jgi:NADH:ubiquinone oxidoreductase subunit E